jgi:hypothetical protein
MTKYKNIIGIVGLDKESGENFFKSISIHLDIEKRYDYLKKSAIETKNGNLYEIIPYRCLSRGGRFNQVFIEIGINADIINYVIEPKIIRSDSINEEDQIIYFYKCDNGGYFFFKRRYAIKL